MRLLRAALTRRVDLPIVAVILLKSAEEWDSVEYVAMSRKRRIDFDRCRAVWTLASLLPIRDQLEEDVADALRRGVGSAAAIADSRGPGMVANSRERNHDSRRYHRGQFLVAIAGRRLARGTGVVRGLGAGAVWFDAIRLSRPARRAWPRSCSRPRPRRP